MPLTPANIEAVNAYVNMPESDYKELETASPVIINAVDMLRNILK